MPAPTNISFGTATDLGTLPASVTQTVDFAGTTYTVFYKFTAPSDAVVVGAFGFGDLAVYKPIITPYDALQAQILSITNQNKPIQFPVTAGAVHYLKFVPNGGNPTPAVLTLNVQKGPTGTLSIGSIAAPDDTPGFPLGIASGTANYTMVKFIGDFPASEQGDTLASGIVLMYDSSADLLKLYSADFALLVTLASLGFSNPVLRTCLGMNQFYVGVKTNPITVKTVTSAGAFGATTYTLTGNTTINAIAASNDGATIYFANTGTNAAVKTWVTASNTAGANLAAGIVNYTVNDILVLTDTSIIVGYRFGTTDYKAIRYSAAGATLNTYTLGGSSNTTPRLAYAIDDPNSFWVWTHPVATAGLSRFLNIKASDGTTLTTRDQEEFETGEYGGAETATPLARFGVSFSCPFWITRTGSTPTTQVNTIRRQRRFLLPSSDTNKRMRIPTIEILMRTGIGLKPDAWDSGLNEPLGADPQIMFRLSKDGGMTWGPERVISAGLRGQFYDRVRLLQATGIYRNAVLEVTVDDPVDWQFLAALGDPVESSH